MYVIEYNMQRAINKRHRKLLYFEIYDGKILPQQVPQLARPTNNKPQ